MLYTVIDQYGNVKQGLSPHAGYSTGFEIKNTAINYDLTNNKSVLVHLNEVRYTLEQRATSYNGFMSKIAIYRSEAGKIKFGLLNKTEVMIAVIYPIGDNSSLTDSVKIAEINCTNADQDPFFFITTIEGDIQAVKFNGETAVIQNIEAVTSISNTRMEVSLNSPNTELKTQIADVIETTSDLASESAAKYVSR